LPAARSIDNILGGPWRYNCWPADKGEFWFDDYVDGLLAGPCQRGCAHVRVLQVFNMTLPRYNSHMGSMGRGMASGEADCRHWCNNVYDWWSILLYNMLIDGGQSS
jgi:hypothetical protein